MLSAGVSGPWAVGTEHTGISRAGCGRRRTCCTQAQPGALQENNVRPCVALLALVNTEKGGMGATCAGGSRGRGVQLGGSPSSAHLNPQQLVPLLQARHNEAARRHRLERRQRRLLDPAPLRSHTHVYTRRMFMAWCCQNTVCHKRAAVRRRRHGRWRPKWRRQQRVRHGNSASTALLAGARVRTAPQKRQGGMLLL
jgi:hypothetical protein